MPCVDEVALYDLAFVVFKISFNLNFFIKVFENEVLSQFIYLELYTLNIESFFSIILKSFFPFKLLNLEIFFFQVASARV